ncbi:hypothetical protein BC829DRAFT_385095 [Chytridium lagenaria]|nr:hypothetical protein BC829DRAFT_385095 [Chytridium lagenaria]
MLAADDVQGIERTVMWFSKMSLKGKTKFLQKLIHEVEPEDRAYMQAFLWPTKDLILELAQKNLATRILYFLDLPSISKASRTCLTWNTLVRGHNAYWRAIAEHYGFYANEIGIDHKDWYPIAKRSVLSWKAWGKHYSFLRTYCIHFGDLIPNRKSILPRPSMPPLMALCIDRDVIVVTEGAGTLFRFPYSSSEVLPGKSSQLLVRYTDCGDRNRKRYNDRFRGLSYSCAYSQSILAFSGPSISLATWEPCGYSIVKRGVFSSSGNSEAYIAQVKSFKMVHTPRKLLFPGLKRHLPSARAFFEGSKPLNCTKIDVPPLVDQTWIGHSLWHETILLALNDNAIYVLDISDAKERPLPSVKIPIISAFDPRTLVSNGHGLVAVGFKNGDVQLFWFTIDL